MNSTYSMQAGAGGLVSSVLLQITVILLVALLVQRALLRVPAARHGVLFWALISVGICPFIAGGIRCAGIGPPIPLPRTWTHAQINAAVSSAVADAAPVTEVAKPDATGFARSRSASLLPLVLLVWTGGAIVFLLRVGIGVYRIIRIRRHASPVQAAALDLVSERLCSMLGSQLPKILESDELAVPATVGFIRPAVVLPSGLAERLKGDELLQILVHECAHASRRDPLMGLYQRLLGSVYWFHPLVHWANRQLDESREDLCDNFVLRAASPTAYAHTLVTIAESIPVAPMSLPAATLFGSRSSLERRVSGLVSTRRSSMTGLNRWMAMTIAGLFIAGGTALSSFGEVKPTTKNSQHDERLSIGPAARDLPYAVKYELGATSFLDGDDITITEVRGTADTVALGNIYSVKGTYKLASREKASLTANVTVHKAADDGGPSLQVQNVNVNKGEGTFTLYLPIYVDGCPHVSFYSETQSIGGVYFGTGKSLYQDQKVKESKSDTAESLRAELKRLELRLNQLERHSR